MKKYGLKCVGGMDLWKCFDRLDHGLVVQEVNRNVSYGSVLPLIRQFLEAVVMNGVPLRERGGGPQGVTSVWTTSTRR